jgi:hypothetical protein
MCVCVCESVHVFLGIEPRDLCMLSRFSSPVLHLQSKSVETIQLWYLDVENL